jgi:hypothetical protein
MITFTLTHSQLFLSISGLVIYAILSGFILCWGFYRRRSHPTEATQASNQVSAGGQTMTVGFSGEGLIKWLSIVHGLKVEYPKLISRRMVAWNRKNNGIYLIAFFKGRPHHFYVARNWVTNDFEQLEPGMYIVQETTDPRKVHLKRVND